jgi:hypothetical protein
MNTKLHIFFISAMDGAQKENVQQLCLTVSYWHAFVRKLL